MHYQSPEKPHRLLRWVIGGTLIIVLLLVAGVYQGLLAARLAPGLAFKVTGPKTLAPGKPAVITWDLAPRHAEQNRFEKIEYCSGTLLKQKCFVLAASAGNTGKAVVQVSASLPTGIGFIRLTARDNKSGGLLAALSSTSAAVTVKATTPAPEASEQGGGGGDTGGSGGSSGDSGSSGGSAPVPTMVEPTPIDTGSPSPSATLDPSATPEVSTTPTPEPTAEPTATPSVTPEPTATPTVTPTPTLTAAPSPPPASPALGGASAQFVVPANAEAIGPGDLVDIRVQLNNVTAASLVCQEWLLDGVVVTADRWTGGKLPLNVPAC